MPYAGIHTPAVFSDQSVLPPKEIGRYPVFVPKADDGGVAIARIHQFALAVPRTRPTHHISLIGALPCDSCSRSVAFHHR